jgi:hypothetical protein
MAFWSKWFAPACLDCEDKVVEGAIEVEGGIVCGPCHGKREAAEAARQAEVEARRKAEEEARARFEDRKAFGSDPRTR